LSRHWQLLSSRRFLSWWPSVQLLRRPNHSFKADGYAAA
jgi:hypothetical protein